jgi:hypothetical protein
MLLHDTALSFERIAVWDKQVNSEQPDNHGETARYGYEKPAGSRIAMLMRVVGSCQPVIL